jgi:hypothetical protein
LIPGVKTETGPQMRLVVAIHAATSSPPPLMLSEMVLFTNGLEITLSSRLRSHTRLKMVLCPLHCLSCRVGAGRPLPGRPYPPLRTVRAACHRTRLSPDLLLVILSFREFSLVEQVVALGTED